MFVVALIVMISETIFNPTLALSLTALHSSHHYHYQTSSRGTTTPSKSPLNILGGNNRRNPLVTNYMRLNDSHDEKEASTIMKDVRKKVNTLAVITTITALTFTSPNLSIENIANAYGDYASDTVSSIIKSIDTSAGNQDQTFAAFKELADIITEGKGLGGDVSYGGVQLERGLVADEDTSIYNPGLSLLTESEKNSVVNAIVRNKQTALKSNTWSQDNQLGFEFLKQKLDPYHMYELTGYLKILPFYAAVLYLGVLAVQQNLRGFFPASYIVAALAVFAPIGVLIAAGP